jgi:hypothetical protein
MNERSVSWKFFIVSQTTMASRILSVNQHNIWTRSRSQVICIQDRPQPKAKAPKPKATPPARKKFKADDDENTECLGFSADEIRFPNLKPFNVKRKLGQQQQPEPEEMVISESKNRTKSKPKSKKTHVGAKVGIQVINTDFCLIII